MTKIMTVILGIENFDDLDQKITLTNEMCAGLYEQDATQAGFQPGEDVRVIDLLYGAMLPSGAECCIALADTISGSEADFAELMNKKAAKLGWIIRISAILQGFTIRIITVRLRILQC